ncbi:uncharacterized protein LOC133805668 [Humulus lupulus]|uniref:uncharacterized protein LOC133805668 n=1 Tax=Humulus lupulus TaxID=3486 RepID=UPI002B406D90|nr:uncharacterized protein LOC133805668 [Humulus lupulus]
MEEFIKLNHGTILIITSSLVLLLFSSPLAQCHVASSPSPSQAPQQSQSQNNHDQQYFHSTLPKRRPHHKSNDQVDLIASINKICSVTQDPKLCAESILPHVRGHVDPVMALQTEINIFIGTMGKGITEMKAALKHSSTGTTTADCLRLCLDMYSTARMDLKQALQAIKSHDIGLLNSLLSGVITNIGTCDDTVSESGEELPLDTDLVNTIHKLADNCMDISAVLLV